MNAEVAFNKTNCIVTKNHWGYDTLVNICNGTTRNIDWTWMDYAGVAGMGIVALLLLAFVGCFIFMIVDNLRW